MGKFFVLKIEKIEVIMLLQLVVNRVTLLWFVGYSWGGGGGLFIWPGTHVPVNVRILASSPGPLPTLEH